MPLPPPTVEASCVSVGREPTDRGSPTVDLAWVGDFFMPEWRKFGRRRTFSVGAVEDGRCPFGVSWRSFWSSHRPTDGSPHYRTIHWKCLQCGCEFIPGGNLSHNGSHSYYEEPSGRLNYDLLTCFSSVTGTRELSRFEEVHA